MSNEPKFKNQHLEQAVYQIDHETGAILHETKVFKRKVTKEHFMIVYLSDLSPLLGLKSGVEHRVLEWMWRESEFGSNRIFLVKKIKEELAEELKINYRTVANTITSLTKKKLILRGGRSVYYLNPAYFFKGSEMQRKKTIEVLMRYEIMDPEELEEE